MRSSCFAMFWLPSLSRSSSSAVSGTRGLKTPSIEPRVDTSTAEVSQTGFTAPYLERDHRAAEASSLGLSEPDSNQFFSKKG